MREDFMGTLLIVAIAAAVGVLLGGTSLVLHFTGDDGPEAPTSTQAVKVDGADADRKRDDTIEAPEALVQQVERSDVGEHEGLRDESLPTAPQAEIEAAERKQEQVRDEKEPLPTAGATQGFPGCRTAFVGNQSSRRGVRPSLIIDHYTVSLRRPGWGDVNAIVAFFNNPASQASSHFVIDDEGHCAYIVPIEAKAWTAAAMNPFGVQIEVIAMGNETLFMPVAGLMKLVAVHQEIGRRVGSPMRRGAVSGCVPTRSGIVQHADGGLCAGGHHDIKPFSIDEVVRASQVGVRPDPLAKLTKRERLIVNRRCFHFRQRFRAGMSVAAKREHLRHSKTWKSRAGARKAELTRLGNFKRRSRGIRRLRMAQAESFKRKHRRTLC